MASCEKENGQHRVKFKVGNIRSIFAWEGPNVSRIQLIAIGFLGNKTRSI